MVREFHIENEVGQRFSMMDIEQGCFLNIPRGLGYSYDAEYSQIGNDFICNIRKFAQGQIGGDLVFRNYDNYKNFVDFVESSESIKFVYRVPYDGGYVEYFKDVDIAHVDKEEIRS